jgi:hypothetical protein
MVSDKHTHITTFIRVIEANTGAAVEFVLQLHVVISYYTCRAAVQLSVV